MVGGSTIIKGSGGIFETYKNLLEQILSKIRILENNSIGHKEEWSMNQLFTIKSEIKELYDYAEKGKIFFKYGNKQRMLVSTYCVTESLFNLNSTDLGKLILSLQELYNSF